MPFFQHQRVRLAAPTSSRDDHPADIRPQLAFGHAPALHLPNSVGHDHNRDFALQRLTASTAPSSGTLC